MKYDIVIVCNGMEFNDGTYNLKDLGGSETMCLLMARKLALSGHRVTVFSNSEEKAFYNKKLVYKHISQAESYIKAVPHDICIVQRISDYFRLSINSKLNIFWTHDLALKRYLNNVNGVLWNIDAVFLLSDFMKKQYKKVYGDHLEKLIFKTRNCLLNDDTNRGEKVTHEPIPIEKPKDGNVLGIVPRKVKEIRTKIERKDNVLVYTARPERGLDLLLEKIFPIIYKEIPGVKLKIAGYNNYSQELQALYNKINALGNQYPKGTVEHLGGLTKKGLSDLYQESSLYVYPTYFEETSCITAMETAENGLPFVCTEKGALPETVKRDVTGVIVSGDIYQEETQKRYAEKVIELLRNPEERKRISESAVEYSKNYSIDGVVTEWEDFFDKKIAENNDNKSRLGKSLLFNENGLACKHLLKGDFEGKAEIEKEFNFRYDFAVNQEEYKKSYAETDQGIHPNSFANSIREPRLQKTLIELQKDIPEHGIKSILDFACAHGGYTTTISNEFPEVKVEGWDINPKWIDYANQKKEEFSKSKDNLSFYNRDENFVPPTGELQIKQENIDNPDKPLEHKKYDAMLAYEVLEHVNDPTEFIEKLEKNVKDDGWIYITVPFGSWLSNMLFLEGKINKPLHQSSFDRHDIEDMFGKKKNLKIDVMPGGESLLDKSQLGWYFIKYQKSSAATGEIDYDRKLKLQRPRQTLTTCIIARDSETYLLRCLKSVEKLSDEIIIIDNGSVDTTEEIAKRFDKVKLIKRPDLNPLQVGFEATRNESLKHATSDWILWIDTDEELQNFKNVFKYLKNNVFNGYGVQQHHFTCEGNFPPDLPVRFFRNHKDIQFYGIIHEHPETTMNKGVEQAMVIGDVHIAHDGYLTDEAREKKFYRNWPLLVKDRQKYPDRVLGYFLEMRDHIHWAKIKMNRGVDFAEIGGHCQTVINMYREQFLTKNANFSMAREAYNQYREALLILNQGFEVRFSMSKNLRNPTPLQDLEIYRFANSEDMKTFITNEAMRGMDMIEGEYI